jgi:hypothetical protein
MDARAALFILILRLFDDKHLDPPAAGHELQAELIELVAHLPHGHGINQIDMARYQMAAT